MTAALQDRIDALEAENRWLRNLLYGRCQGALAARYGLTGSEAKVLACLARHELASHAIIFAALWGDDPNGGPANPGAVVSQFILRLRRKLPARLRPIAVHGVGVHLPPAAREEVQGVCRGASGEGAA